MLTLKLACCLSDSDLGLLIHAELPWFAVRQRRPTIMCCSIFLTQEYATPLIFPLFLENIQSTHRAILICSFLRSKITFKREVISKC